MCISCGCGDANERHHAGDITYADLEKAAFNAGIDPEEAADNIRAAARKARDGDASSRGGGPNSVPPNSSVAGRSH